MYPQKSEEMMELKKIVHDLARRYKKVTKGNKQDLQQKLFDVSNILYKAGYRASIRIARTHQNFYRSYRNRQTDSEDYWKK